MEGEGMNKPQMRDFGFVHADHYELEGGWAIEGGEEAYWKAWQEWTKQEREKEIKNDI